MTEDRPLSLKSSILRSHQVSRKLGPCQTPDREESLYFSSVPLAPQIVRLYVNKDSQIDFDVNLLGLKDLRIGIVSTRSYGPKFDVLRRGLKLSRSEKLEYNFKNWLLVE